MESVELFHMSICQGNTSRKDLSWLHFHDESRECHLLSPSHYGILPQHIIYFSIFSGFHDKALSLLQVLFSLSTVVEIYMIMYICTCTYAYTVYIYAGMCVFVCECVCVYIYIYIYVLKFCIIFENEMKRI